MVTAPLFAFTSLPLEEVVKPITETNIEDILIPVLENSTEVVNVTDEVVLNRTIGVNITEGESFFLEPQPAPEMIDSDIVLCIDLSGSMDTGSPLSRMNITQLAIHRFLQVLNRSTSLGITEDRVALVTYFGSRDFDWFNDSRVDVGLEYISNTTHFSTLQNETDALTPYTTTANYYTDIWAGLNYSLDILLDNPRSTPTMKLILLLTDGEHNTGPWGIDVGNGNYDGFLSLQPNASANYLLEEEFGPNSANPIITAKQNDIKIYSIGMLTDADQEEFLQQISENPTNGTGGRYFDGDDIFNLSEAFIRARDEASGWTPVLTNDTSIVNTGTSEYFVYNVTEETKRLKWDLNWNSSSVNVNLTITNPNGTVITPKNNTFENIKFLIGEQPYTILIDFPLRGNWTFRINWENISIAELVKGRLSSYEPPIFIESVKRLNATDSNQSVLFLVNVTNKNPTFTYTNITPYLLGNFSLNNISMNWSPSSISNLPKNSTTSFQLNLTFNEPVFLQGDIFFKVNCSEGFHDAVTQEVLLDYRVFTENITVDKYTTEITVTELQTIQITVTSWGTTVVTKNTQLRRDVDTLKWAGFFITLGLLLSFLVAYVSAHAYQLRSLAKSFRTRLFPDQTILELALEKEGISVAPEELSAIIEATDDLDQFGENIFTLTGKKLTPEDLIRLTSGVSTDQVISRLSFVTGRSPDEISALLNQAPSVEALITQLSLDEARFLDIITQDEQVLNFQAKVSTLILPVRREVSQIVLKDDLDISRFRSRLRKKL